MVNLYYKQLTFQLMVLIPGLALVPLLLYIGGSTCKCCSMYSSCQEEVWSLWPHLRDSLKIVGVELIPCMQKDPLLECPKSGKDETEG